MIRSSIFSRTSLGDESPASQTSAPSKLWAIILASSLIAARILVLSTRNSGTFWYVWSGAVGLISFLSPMSGVALSIANVFVSLDDSSPLGLSTGQIAGAAAAVRLILQFATHRISLSRIWRPSHAIFGGIMLVILLSALLSDYPAQPWPRLVKLLLILLLYVITLVYVGTFERLLFIQIVVVISATMAAALTLNDPRGVEDVKRATGLVGNSNYQAIYLAVAMPLIVSLWLHVKSILWRILIIAAGGVSVVAIIATASRGGLLVLGIAFVLMMLTWGQQGKRIRLMFGVMLLVFVFALTSDDAATERYLGTIDNVSQGTAQLETRVSLADDSLALWFQHPLLGVGADNWLAGVRNEVGVPIAYVAHVWPTQILAELGIVGFGLYLAFVYQCIKDYNLVLKHLKQQASPYTDVLRGFFIAALTMSFAWTSGNPYNQLWFELLFIGGVFAKLLIPDRHKT